MHFIKCGIKNYSDTMNCVDIVIEIGRRGFFEMYTISGIIYNVSIALFISSIRANYTLTTSISLELFSNIRSYRCRVKVL